MSSTFPLKRLIDFTSYALEQLKTKNERCYKAFVVDHGLLANAWFSLETSFAKLISICKDVDNCLVTNLPNITSANTVIILGSEACYSFLY